MRLDLDAEFEAAEVLARAGVMAPPVDPRRLVRLWTGLRVTVADLDGAGYMVDLGPRGGEILVRAGDSPARRSFTCAHELGHWVLRAQDAGDVVRLPRAVVERWCDRFAVALLMPRAWVTSELVAGSLRIEAIAALADRFGVSLQTMLLRVSEVAPMDLALATSPATGLKIKWRTSRDGDGRFEWIDLSSLCNELARRPRVFRSSVGGAWVQATMIRPERWLLGSASIDSLSQWSKLYGRAPQPGVPSPHERSSTSEMRDLARSGAQPKGGGRSAPPGRSAYSE